MSDFPSIGETGKQPPRADGDGPLSFRKLSGTRLAITVEQDGNVQTLIVSAYNAWRVFGTLAWWLGAKLPAKLEKEISL